MSKEDYENMIKKAKKLVGTWIYRMPSDEYCYVYSYAESAESDQDVVLFCIAIYEGYSVYNLSHPYIMDLEVHMRDFDAFYCKVPAAKVARPLKVWEEIKAFYDRMFNKGE